MKTELLRPGYSNISCTEDWCSFGGSVMSTELEVSTEKKSVFEKTTIIFFNLFVREKGSIPYLLRLLTHVKVSVRCLFKR